MNKSLTYYLTLLVIRIKGIKKIFSQDPINFRALRKDDVHHPRQRFFKSGQISRYKLSQTSITVINNDSKKLLIYLHGGAFISGPAHHHWATIKTLAQSTNYTLWFCDYPKAPEHNIVTINKNIDLVYHTARNTPDYEDIVFVGDSAGGTLILTLMQRLVALNQPLPSKIIVISPVLDASFENPEIIKLEKKDPMLSIKGVISAKKMCVEDGNLKNKSISPIYGDFKGFPPTYLFIAEHDITFPDQLIFCDKLKADKVEHYVNIGKEMPHIWPLLPVMTESKKALNEIIKIIN